NTKLASLVLAAIHADIDAAQGKGEAASASPEEPPPSGPAFGQVSPEGGETVIYPEPPPSSPPTPPAVAAQQPSDPRLAKNDFAVPHQTHVVWPSHCTLAELDTTVTHVH